METDAPVPAQKKVAVARAEADSSLPTPKKKAGLRREQDQAQKVTTTTPDTETTKDEPGDFVETHCNWKNCGIEFGTQDELVRHINDHIQQNKKMFVCRWKSCSREEKPFKAMYMLVVHMRRHTGNIFLLFEKNKNAIICNTKSKINHLSIYL